ncbi:MAG: GntR family transcriptional regulator [Planctomycetes bacterium]|nr:GntR family transcriptional regulator [Planctomycetota bacterium]
MIFHVDPQSPEPIFEQLTSQVKDAIARGELADGDRLPSVRDLARQVAVNPNTVQKAYDSLHTEGVIVRRQGAGCFVSGRPALLRDDERERRLTALLHRAVTEAFHLGFRATEVRAALERELKTVQFPRRRRKES